jgi:hypothetical protein
MSTVTLWLKMEQFGIFILKTAVSLRNVASLEV